MGALVQPERKNERVGEEKGFREKEVLGDLKGVFRQGKVCGGLTCFKERYGLGEKGPLIPKKHPQGRTLYLPRKGTESDRKGKKSLSQKGKAACISIERRGLHQGRGGKVGTPKNQKKGKTRQK